MNVSSALFDHFLTLLPHTYLDICRGRFYFFCTAAEVKDIMVVFGKRNGQNQIGLETIYCLKLTGIASAAIEIIP